MHRDDRLSGAQIFWWSVLGVGTGVVLGFALSEWVGDVNPLRVRRAAERLRQNAPVRLSRAASALAVLSALRQDPRLADLPIEAVAAGRGAVELRGWVPTRAARTLAARVARSVTGVDTIVNSLLVRGEDDRTLPGGRATDQSA